MLEKIKEKIIRQKAQTKDKKSLPFLKQEEVEQLHRQFHHVRGFPQEKRNTIRWRRMKQYQDLLVRAELEGTAGYTFKLGFKEVIEAIENLLMDINLL